MRKTNALLIRVVQSGGGEKFDVLDASRSLTFDPMPRLGEEIGIPAGVFDYQTTPYTAEVVKVIYPITGGRVMIEAMLPVEEPGDVTTLREYFEDKGWTIVEHKAPVPRRRR